MMMKNSTNEELRNGDKAERYGLDKDEELDAM
jgi:hypothetical protein